MATLKNSTDMAVKDAELTKSFIEKCFQGFKKFLGIKQKEDKAIGLLKYQGDIDFTKITVEKVASPEPVAVAAVSTSSSVSASGVAAPAKRLAEVDLPATKPPVKTTTKTTTKATTKTASKSPRKPSTRKKTK